MTTETTRHKQLEAQFHQAQKMEAIGRLAGGIAHDFNNLLTSVLGYTELVIDTMDPDDQRRQDLVEVRKAGQSAVALTRQLLTFSRKHAVEHQVVDVNAVLREFERIIRRTIGEDIEVALRLETGPWRIIADPGQLEQVLMNLCVNARDAMPQGGRLTISTGNALLRESRLVATGQVCPGQYVMVSVSDTGVGMAPETQARLFEPFFTTKESGKGTGLGLSTVYGVVKESRGHIGVTSEPNQGTTLTIYLPRVEDRPLSAGVPPVQATGPGGSETVLVVEDSDGPRSLIARMLGDLGYSVLTASSAPDALAVSDVHSRPIDLLLTDVVMPGGDGLALARELVSRRPGIRVLHMSGYADAIAAQCGLHDSDWPLLHKPFDRLTLAKKVREALAPALSRVADSTSSPSPEYRDRRN